MGTLRQGIVKARSRLEAVPKDWQEGDSDGKPRIDAKLLADTRKKIAVDAELLANARSRLVIVRAEAALRQATDGNDLEALQKEIAKCERVEGVSEELLASSRAALVKRAESQLAAACGAGDL